MAQSAREAGREVFVIGLRGCSTKTGLVDFPHEWVSLGEPGRAFKRSKRRAPPMCCWRAGWTGPIFRTQAGRQGRDGAAAVVAAARRATTPCCGSLVEIFEQEGFRAMSVAEAAPGTGFSEGALGQIAPNADHQADIARGFRHRAGAGRAGCWTGRRRSAKAWRLPSRPPKAPTDDRPVGSCARLCAARPTKKRGVLVKALKPTQDAKTDMPVIGVETVRNARAVGLAGIALEAGKSLIVDKRAVAAEADRLGLFVAAQWRWRREAGQDLDAGLRRAFGRPAGGAVDGGHQDSGDRSGNQSASAARRWRARDWKACFRSTTTAVMGLREVVPRHSRDPAACEAGGGFALKTRPDAVVLIDSPDFTHRIAQRPQAARSQSIRTVNYVAPQVWASRAYRAKAMAHYFDLVLALFPFEVPFFEKYGLKAAFVGHPVIERAPA